VNSFLAIRWAGCVDGARVILAELLPRSRLQEMPSYSVSSDTPASFLPSCSSLPIIRLGSAWNDGRQASPSAAIIDSQNVKTTEANRNRRLAKDLEIAIASATALLYGASTMLLVRRMGGLLEFRNGLYWRRLPQRIAPAS
jgi:hypothetical protein